MTQFRCPSRREKVVLGTSEGEKVVRNVQGDAGEFGGRPKGD